jgi:hypothetical protein
MENRLVQIQLRVTWGEFSDQIGTSLSVGGCCRDKEAAMRASILTLCAACVLLTTPAHAAAPANSEDATLFNIEALADREPDRWQGRHHYLYDDEHQPGSATVGSAPSDPRACANEPVRMRRSDGSTVVRRIRRCD